MTCPPHRYRIEEANGPTVRGECQKCGLKRTYATGETDMRVVKLARKDERRISSWRGE